MTLLSGLWRFSDHSDPLPLSQAVSSMLAAQQTGAREPAELRSRVRSIDSVAVGRIAQPTRSAPFSGADECDAELGLLFAADVRLDNRSELIELLGCRGGPPIDDEGLLLLAYRRWEDRLVDVVVGDFAFAAWNPRTETLTLVRDPTGQRPLHYRINRDSVAFASMPQGLLVLDTERRELNAGRLAQFVAALPLRGPETFFRGIMRVEPAHIVRITRAGMRMDRYWTMPSRELQYRRPGDYAEAFRETLDRATKDRLRDGGTVVASHLSAGLDSGTVTATAARLVGESGGRVLAITSAPRVDFAGPVPRGRIADESPLAALLAARYPDIDHLVLRTDGASPFAVLDEDTRRVAQPVGHPCNNLWWRRTNEAARDHGATVMLTGETGNLTISAGSLNVLADYWRTGRYLQWLREVLALRKRGPRWRGLMAASFSPWMPPAALASLRRFAADGPAADSELLLSEEFRGSVEAEAARFDTTQARMTERELRWDMLASSDPGSFRKGALLGWGIEERDPTADRRLVEFCFALPPDQLLGGGETRRLARAALADRLPPEILNGPRGYQFADWYESVDHDALASTARRMAASPVAARVLDLQAIDRMIEAWPPRDWASMKTMGGYRVGLLRALSAGIFALKAGG